jgi:hypothetical protein
VEQAMRWNDGEIVRRYCADNGQRLDDGEACFSAFKQFMVVCAEGDDVRAPSEPVDEMWHTALLFTRSYRDFCERYLGTFIHHVPVEDKADAAVYADTRRLAGRRFGALDERFWPSADAVARCGGCGSIYVP